MMIEHGKFRSLHEGVQRNDPQCKVVSIAMQDAATREHSIVRGKAQTSQTPLFPSYIVISLCSWSQKRNFLCHSRIDRLNLAAP
jgi:hypothetical protein